MWPTNQQLTLIRSLLVVAAASCTVPNPNYRPRVDASVDPGGGVCSAKQPLRCHGANLVRCNATGDAEVSEPCAFGCSAAELRCLQIAPSNGLGAFLAQASSEPDLDLGDWATIDTDTGAVTLGGAAMVPPPKTALHAQAGAPAIRVLIVRSLKAKNVDIVGKNAFAVVSSGSVAISGTLSASAKTVTAGAGSHSDEACHGQTASASAVSPWPGSGGGGFGTAGGAGGIGVQPRPSGIPIIRAGAPGGASSGTPTLMPLRGGCNGGGGDLGGGGGGAIALVSNSNVVVTGTVAANGGGAGGNGTGGGAGGAILVEAPVVEISGTMVANGGGGGGCGVALDGGMDQTPATGSLACAGLTPTGAGGNGAAGSVDATNGTGSGNTAGGGGGGAGRIRVNTASGTQPTTGLYSPAPTWGGLTIQ